MKEPSNEDLFDQFFDAPDEFSFSDCIKDIESELVESVGSSIISEVEFKEGKANESVSKKPNTLRPSFPDGLRRRSPSFELGKKIGSNFAEDLNSRSPVVSEIVEVSEEKIIPRVKKNNIKEKKKKAREVSDPSEISSDKTIKDNGESKRNQENSVVTSENENSSLGNKSFGKFLGKFGWGFFWSVYVCTILFGLLVSGFVIGGILMRYLVEEPFQFTGVLNFDYTKPKPVALVPLMSCPSASCGLNCEEKPESGRFIGSRAIPPNHKLQLTVSLTLPESDYNKKLGVFQVRLEILSASGRVTDSSRHTSMLRYKSQLITYLETFLKSASLLAGYSSEEQVLKLKMRGFTEGYDPTSCIRVILEQRAEYRPGAGVPEIYGASLVLESELPILKRIIWHWKKTILIWISMVLFLMQFLMILVCCRPIIIPRIRPRCGSANNNGCRNNRAQTRAS
ncbi:hypothetical protein C5167_008648 [Papaver somniferum]|uniref:Seipin n=1 Tax=Papaver somniferum TaxID=3469 RepID=A0A4Y7JWL1_PAPSO|nr:hypothetical protein C5167_008648 [Papaver somniferum]